MSHTPPSDDALREAVIAVWNETAGKSHEETIDALVALFTTTQAKAVAEAERRGVAWCIANIDQMHLIDKQTDSATDRTYKGIKNRLRDSFKFVTGVDPAPHYPVEVELQQSQQEEQSE